MSVTHPVSTTSTRQEDFITDTLRINLRELLQKNKRVRNGYQYIVPSPELYPFQWFWDSCFHAIILSTFAIEDAKNELRSVTSSPMFSGMLPHIIYWKDPDDVQASNNWGRELRGDIINEAWGVENTSAITQPPILAKALEQVYLQSNDIAFLEELYPVVKAYYIYLYEHRSLSPDGPLFIVNPDESGEDNSPRFDAPQELSRIHTADENLDKRIERMRQNASCKFDTKECMSKHFAVADVSFNTIYAESLEILSRLAGTLQHPEDERFFADCAKIAYANIQTLYDEESTLYYSRDLISNKLIPVTTWNIFMPLYGGFLSQAQANKLVYEVLLDPKQFWTEYPVPTVSLQDATCDFAEDAFWRGPVWVVPNYFIYHGLKRYGFTDIANELKRKTIAMIEKEGFREHYHPLTGKGLGAHDFTWAGLLLAME